MKTVCIFHDRAELRHAKAIANLIERADYKAWFTDRDSSDDWRSDVEKVLTRDDCVGAIVIWSDAALRNSIVVDEAETTVGHNKKLLSVVLGDIRLPIGLRNTPRVVIEGWDGVQDHGGLTSIVAKLARMATSTVLSRINELSLAGQVLKCPAFVFSVSSFETQISPARTLELLNLFSPDAVLISAYDVLGISDGSPDITPTRAVLEELERKGPVLFLDSGNYEAYRLGNEWWQRSPWLLKEAASRLSWDIVFSHDRIVETAVPTEVSIAELADKIVGDAQRDSDTIGGQQVSPIVHAPRQRDGSFHAATLPHLCEIVAKQLRPPLIAVPERELGDGILERGRRVRTIRRALDRVGFQQPLHVLGTGNPLSIMILALAGGDIFDGLEWCRTVADGTSMHLHHFHHFDLFLTQRREIQNAELREFLEAKDELLSAKAKAVLHNLYFFQRFMTELQQAHLQGGYEELFARYLPGEYNRVLRRIEMEDTN